MDHQPVEVFVARQPIFDRERRVSGYELLYRSSAANRFTGEDADVASSVNLERTLLGFGLESLTQGRDAWINASRVMLVNDHWALMPAEHTVVEVLETVTPDADVIAACRRIKRAGYRIALDDFASEPAWEPLVALADIAKVDVRQHDPAACRTLARRLGKLGLTLVAEKIESHEEFQAAQSAGYSLFQGYFFCRPELLKTRDMAPNRVSYLRLLKEVHAAELDFGVVEQLIRQDVALSIKLLRFLRSASFGWTHEVTSIQQAILLLGERQLRKWAALVAVFGLGRGKPAELIVTALARARFAERLAPHAGLAGHELELFLCGLLSVVEALTDQPMVEALAGLALPDAVRGALESGAPPLGEVMRLVLAWERADWDEADRLLDAFALSERDAAGAYSEALLWAENHAQP